MIIKVKIKEMPGVVEEEAVRIFLEFKRQECAIKGNYQITTQIWETSERTQIVSECVGRAESNSTSFFKSSYYKMKSPDTLPCENCFFMYLWESLISELC